MKHPIQPVVENKHGTWRFKENAIVSHLLEHGQKTGCGLNEIACMKFDQDDRSQFAQLIGYSLSGYGDLSYHDDGILDTAYKMHEKGLTEEQARITVLEEELKSLKEAVKEATVKFAALHVED